MYKELLNKNVNVFVSTKTQNFLEYSGILSEETDEAIVLKNVSIGVPMGNLARNMFGDSNFSKYQEGLETVIINKEYIISCNKNI